MVNAAVRNLCLQSHADQYQPGATYSVFKTAIVCQNSYVKGLDIRAAAQGTSPVTLPLRSDSSVCNTVHKGRLQNDDVYWILVTR